MRAIKILSSHFSFEEITYVRDQYSNKRPRTSKELEKKERERIKKLLNELKEGSNDG